MRGAEPGPSGSGTSDTCPPGAVARPKLLNHLVRAGFAARAITYAIIGGLALALAVGAGTLHAAPNQQGALELIGRTLAGRVALLGIAVGLLAYALWKFEQAVLGRGPEGGGHEAPQHRVSNAGAGLIYLVFFAVAVRAFVNSGANSASGQRQATASVLAWPGGPLLVGLSGVALVLISIYQIVDAIRGGFIADCKSDLMSPEQRRLYVRVGRVGLVARAAVFALVGYFLVRAAVAFNHQSAVGLNGALERLRDNQPFGAWLVGFAAAGMLIFAVFSMLEGRYRQL